MRPADPPYVNGDDVLGFDDNDIDYGQMMARREINRLLDEMEAV